MLVKVHSITEKSALVTVNGKDYQCKVIPNKYNDKEILVSLRDVQVLLGEGEHKNWLTLNKQDVEATLETIKQHHDNFITTQNIEKYLSPEDYAVVKPLIEKAQKKLELINAEKRLVKAQEDVKNGG